MEPLQPDDEDDVTPIEALPNIVRDPTKRVVTRDEADRMLAALQPRLPSIWKRLANRLRSLFRRLFRRR